VKSLNGIKNFIVGNHDKKLLKNREFQSLFAEITDYKELDLSGGKRAVLSHYPIPCFNHHFYGWYHFYGHVHRSFEWNMMERVKYEMTVLYDKPCLMFNCGVMMDYINYTPRTIEEILSADSLNQAPVDAQ
jgi:calcineurin-like phosphoesterase family protein